MDLTTFIIATAVGAFGLWVNLVFWPGVQHYGGICKRIGEELDRLDQLLAAGDDEAVDDKALARQLKTCGERAEELAASLGRLPGLYWRYLQVRKRDPAQAVVGLRALIEIKGYGAIRAQVSRIRASLGMVRSG